MSGAEGKIAVITGGTGGLGVAVVRAFLDAGATCHLPVRDVPDPARFPLGRTSRVVVTGGVDLTDDADGTSCYAALPGLHARGWLCDGVIDRDGQGRPDADDVDESRRRAPSASLRRRRTR